MVGRWVVGDRAVLSLLAEEQSLLLRCSSGDGILVMESRARVCWPGLACHAVPSSAQHSPGAVMPFTSLPCLSMPSQRPCALARAFSCPPCHPMPVPKPPCPTPPRRRLAVGLERASAAAGSSARGAAEGAHAGFGVASLQQHLASQAGSAAGLLSRGGGGRCVAGSGCY